MAEVEVYKLSSLRELRRVLEDSEHLHFCVVGSTTSVRTVISNLRQDGEDCAFYYAYTECIADAEDTMTACGFVPTLGRTTNAAGYIYGIVLDEEEIDVDYDSSHDEFDSDDSYDDYCRPARRKPKAHTQIGNIYIGDGRNPNAEALVSGRRDHCSSFGGGDCSCGAY
jgi:hypothetical protein